MQLERLHLNSDPPPTSLIPSLSWAGGRKEKLLKGLVQCCRWQKSTLYLQAPVQTQDQEVRNHIGEPP